MNRISHLLDTIFKNSCFYLHPASKICLDMLATELSRNILQVYDKLIDSSDFIL